MSYSVICLTIKLTVLNYNVDTPHDSYMYYTNNMSIFPREYEREEGTDTHTSLWILSTGHTCSVRGFGGLNLILAQIYSFSLRGTQHKTGKLDETCDSDQPWWAKRKRHLVDR